MSAIVAAGQHILENDGLGAVTMAAVAARVGVRAPSLYKRVRNRDELIRLLAERVAADLGAHLAANDPGGPDTRARLARIVRALRDFARERTAAYRLVFLPPSEHDDLSRDDLASASAPLFDIVARLVEPDHVLPAARTLTAWATGFIAMELSGSFRLGGDVDTAFEYGIERVSAAVTSPAH